MRFRLRLIVSLAIGIVVVSILLAYHQVRVIQQGLRNDLESRAEVVAVSLEEAVLPSVQRKSLQELLRIVQRFGTHEHLAGVAVYGADGSTLAVTPALASQLQKPPSLLSVARSSHHGEGDFEDIDGKPMHVYAQPLDNGQQTVGVLVVFQNAAYISARSGALWRDTFLGMLAEVLVISLITLLILRWSVEGPVARTVQWIRDLRAGGGEEPKPLDEDLFRPLAKEVTSLAQSLAAARAAAEEEARLRAAGEALWTPERLRIHVRNKLEEVPLFVVANREPYMHMHQGNSLQVIVPASGLVTALEPILRACDGTWIASGAGDADHETVDEHDRLRVPPNDPHYTLRRVWVSKEEEQGYYFGFANEGLWPLCHIAHTRPTFRGSDWEMYQKVNKKFAAVVAEEMKGTTQPCVLVQDYHFALAPRLIKEARPDARVAIFWHIPWPNPQAFGICPWQRELLDGLLGADLIGFHIQSHCNHFLETVDSALESRIDWERHSVTRRGHMTLVKPFPISVDITEGSRNSGPAESPEEGKSALFKDLGVEAAFMGVGVDRIDYTKGIPERFRGVERFLEKYPAYQGKFTLAQIGAPSRTHIPRYHDLVAELESEAERINWRFQTVRWKPIVFLKRHHTHQEIDRYYRAADVCLVTSLHDGMNLVAKEFVAAREDERGALVLSRFTGAARELPDALLVNPYDIEQLAEAIRTALEMKPEERKSRMHHMRRAVTDRNIYRWAASLITELSEIRLDRPKPVTAR
jgi:alpha,alpha-trehalose-phosphate synthase [UDP-forming]